MSAGADEPCELLPWDGDFFGFPVARVRRDVLDRAEVRRVDDWCESRHVRLLYFLARWDNFQSNELAWAHGFRFVDLRLTYEMSPILPPDDAAAAGPVRPVRPEDVPQLQTMAHGTFRDSRYYQDPRIPPGKADELFATWIANSCRGYADAVFVAESADVSVARPVGFVTCHWDAPARRASIGLVAVSPDARGRGVGRALVGQALRWAADRGATAARVVTQARNGASLRLYVRCGFTCRDAGLYYHKWYGEGP